MKLSEYMCNGSGVMPLNSLGGSTLQLVVGRGQLYCTVHYLLQHRCYYGNFISWV